MTYFTFHLAFNLPALLLLLWLTRRRLAPRHWRAIAIVCGIVFVFTTPWDNWAVHRGIWDFDWNRVTPVEIPFAGERWRLPVEEYAFFLNETVIVALVTILLLPPPVRDGQPRS